MTTSLQRTYRYLRLGVVGMVVVIFTSVGIAAVTVGWLPSISDYYYSPARTSFTGALLAVSLALFVLSGRGLERVLLDAAALLAPLIALLPTTGEQCLPRCIPAAYEADAANGIATYLIVGALAVAVAAALAAFGQVSWAAVAPTGGLAVVILAALAIAWTAAPAAVLASGHVIATVAFFALFAAVSIISAIPTGRYRAPYALIAILLAVVLVVSLALSPREPVVLVAEAAALTLFAAFWIVQTIEKWDDANPSLQ